MGFAEVLSGQQKTDKKAVFLGSLVCALLILVFAISVQKNKGKLSALHVEGTQLVDEKNEPVQLRGFSTHGLQWFPQYVNQEFFTQMHDEWHMNAVRLAMYTVEGGYIEGDRAAITETVEHGIEYAKAAGMYAIVDWHSMYDSNPLTYVEESKEFFDHISGKFAKETHVLYEICNEPNGGTTWADIKTYAEAVIPVIRKNDPDAVVIVGTPGYSHLIIAPGYDPLTFDNVMYTLHFYAASNKESVRKDMKDALAKNIPVFITEFGVTRGGGGGEVNTEEGELWLSLCDELKVSYMMWNISNKDELSAMLNPEVTKVSGFTEEDLGEGARWFVNRMKKK